MYYQSYTNNLIIIYYGLQINRNSCSKRSNEDKITDNVIVSAITFWFRDEDNDTKLWDYFK